MVSQVVRNELRNHQYDICLTGNGCLANRTPSTRFLGIVVYPPMNNEQNQSTGKLQTKQRNMLLCSTICRAQENLFFPGVFANNPLLESHNKVDPFPSLCVTPGFRIFADCLCTAHFPPPKKYSPLRFTFPEPETPRSAAFRRGSFQAPKQRKVGRCLVVGPHRHGHVRLLRTGGPRYWWVVPFQLRPGLVRLFG